MLHIGCPLQEDLFTDDVSSLMMLGLEVMGREAKAFSVKINWVKTKIRITMDRYILTVRYI